MSKSTHENIGLHLPPLPSLLVLLVLLSACAGNPKSADSPNQCPSPPPCTICETPACPVAKPQVIERERVVTRTIEVEKPRPEDVLALFGQTEDVFLEAAKISLPARVDTGAASCSLHATNIRRFERDGRNFVRFTVPGFDGAEDKTLELPVRRRVLINSQDTGTDLERRIVVRMWLRIANIRERVDVNLADRTGLEYPFLIGRNFLIDNAIVDVSRVPSGG